MTIDASVARNTFSDTINRVAYDGERIIITRRGKEVAAVVPVEDARFLEELEDQIDRKDALVALAKTREKGAIPWDKIKADLDLS